jgi:hypothetical protein
MEVLAPRTDLVTEDRLESHRRLLRNCDGVLLYRGLTQPPDQWLYQTVPDVLFAEQQLGRPPLASRAFLLDDASSLRGFPVPVIPRTADFSPLQLEPFLEPLRKAREAQSRSAHAGG